MSATVMRVPRKLDLELTAQCNLRCRYCYFFNNPAVAYRDVSTDAWLKFFDELGSLGVMDVTLAGGEPFHRADLRELLDGIIRNRMRFALLSNGGLIDDSIAAFLAQSKRCDYVQISLDGSRAETHDAARGIRTLQRNHVRVAVRLTIHRHNVDDLAQFIGVPVESLRRDQTHLNRAQYHVHALQRCDRAWLRDKFAARLLMLGSRVIGRYDARRGAWHIRRTFRLFVDETEL
ncbi:MAG: radical SAM protein [Chloroflexi bacterium]|nr:radical SAM protein [Chloroflexota bacterium]